jgi:hypothetical protein
MTDAKQLVSKPKSISYSHSFTGKYGEIFVFDIEMENGSYGKFSTTKENQDKFSVGKEVTFTEILTKDKNGDYMKIDKVTPKPSGGYGNGTGTGVSKETGRVIIASVCLDCAGTLIDFRGLGKNVKPDLKALHTLADKFFDHIIAKSAGDNQKAINYQSRLKEVINILVKFPELALDTSDKILEYVDKEVEYLNSKKG